MWGIGETRRDPEVCCRSVPAVVRLSRWSQNQYYSSQNRNSLLYFFCSRTCTSSKIIYRSTRLFFLATNCRSRLLFAFSPTPTAVRLRPSLPPAPLPVDHQHLSRALPLLLQQHPSAVRRAPSNERSPHVDFCGTLVILNLSAKNTSQNAPGLRILNE